MVQKFNIRNKMLNMVNENNRKKQNLRSVDIAIKNECPVWKTLKHQEMSQCDSRCVNKMKKNSL